MIITQPTRYFLAAGHADAPTELNALDDALLAAGLADTNLVRMSSILPPACRRIPPVPLPYGALIPAAYAATTSSVAGQTISAAIGVGVPEDPALPGLIMEHHGVAPLAEVEAQVREMVAYGMARRGRAVAALLVIGAEHVVQSHGAAFAGVVLWDDSRREP